MDIPEEEKNKIAQTLLSEKYSAEHKMRERSARFTIWILGVGIALLWILLGKDSLALYQRLIICAFIVFYSALSLWFLAEICKGFKANRGIIIKLEDFLGLYREGEYLEKGTILPTKYRKLFNRAIPSHFKSLYALIIVLAIFILTLVLAAPSVPIISEKNSPKDTQTRYYENPNKSSGAKEDGS